MGQEGEPVSRLLPDQLTIPDLAEAASACRACDLHRRGTQTVFGEGGERAAVMLVGEQPGDREDVEGRPFVGPAGRLLDNALAQAGIDRGQVYVTNVVKHFKWEPRGRRRIHKSPDQAEVGACLPWLRAEIQVVQPRIVVLLGATAARAVLGPGFRVTVDRGRVLSSPLGPPVVPTVHPSSILRDPETRDQALAALVEDLRVAAAHKTGRS